jgi:8-oxo-dGTP pyrophosphatase MutT (NUDIX family)
MVARLAERPPVEADPTDRRQAAVALIVRPDPDRLLLVRRVVRHSDPWSGQVALPGGRRDPTDSDLLDTARRETWEETGFRLERDHSRLALDDLAPSIAVLPRMLVRPYLFTPPEDANLVLNHEIDQASWVTFEELAHPDTRRGVDLEVRGEPMRVIGYHLPVGLLWGLTERIVTPVLEAWLGAGGVDS